MSGRRRVSPEEARRLVEGGAVRLLDVRTREEFAELGHVPGARLLPVGLIACAPAVLERGGPPVLVYCEHGVRSTRAAAVLAQAGFPDVLDLAGGMSVWSGPREFGWSPEHEVGPSPWLLECADLLEGGQALDVACGRGRHALLLAAAGFEVLAVDRDEPRLAGLAESAQALGLPVRTEARDLETGAVDLGAEVFDLVLVTNYLHRPLFPALISALRPGGLLVYETFLQAAPALTPTRGPKSPDHLLRPDELAGLVAPLAVLRAREERHDGWATAAVAARKG